MILEVREDTIYFRSDDYLTIVNTFHSPEELVQLGYLAEVFIPEQDTQKMVSDMEDDELPHFVYNTVLHECLEKSNNLREEYDRFILDAFGDQIEKITALLRKWDK